MKVLVNRSCAAQGQHLEEGKVYELAGDVAAELLRIGRAVAAPAEEPKAKPARKVKADAAE